MTGTVVLAKKNSPVIMVELVGKRSLVANAMLVRDGSEEIGGDLRDENLRKVQTGSTPFTASSAPQPHRSTSLFLRLPERHPWPRRLLPPERLPLRGPPPPTRPSKVLKPRNFSLDEDYFKALDEKHIRYDAEFSRHLMAKYFSGKAFDGACLANLVPARLFSDKMISVNKDDSPNPLGKVYDQETIIENETIKSSRYPFTSSFADPVRHYEEENRSVSPAEENIKCTGQEHPSKKSS
ncbi:uncharacterized protein LOC103717707 [Phoenix dactylifera]|uniref:Uncharacterized protein LOC103717707 n=1 Tax=Phoenix dactylifera TaxID=42345 RepID=A0A8B9A7S3_PHODC|nr:uncharacterized protein LOC103717707 [Phoenix dactylifera]